MSFLENLATGEIQAPVVEPNGTKKQQQKGPSCFSRCSSDKCFTCRSHTGSNSVKKKALVIYYHQKYFLDYIFLKYRSPSNHHLITLAWQIGLPYKIVLKWFFNRQSTFILTKEKFLEKELEQPDRCHLCNYKYDSRAISDDVENHFFSKNHIGQLWLYLQTFQCSSHQCRRKQAWLKIEIQSEINRRHDQFSSEPVFVTHRFEGQSFLRLGKEREFLSMEHAYSKHCFCKTFPTFKQIDQINLRGKEDVKIIDKIIKANDEPTTIDSDSRNKTNSLNEKSYSVNYNQTPVQDKINANISNNDTDSANVPEHSTMDSEKNDDHNYITTNYLPVPRQTTDCANIIDKKNISNKVIVKKTNNLNGKPHCTSYNKTPAEGKNMSQNDKEHANMVEYLTMDSDSRNKVTKKNDHIIFKSINPKYRDVNLKNYIKKISLPYPHQKTKFTYVVDKTDIINKNKLKKTNNLNGKTHGASCKQTFTEDKNVNILHDNTDCAYMVNKSFESNKNKTTDYYKTLKERKKLIIANNETSCAVDTEKNNYNKPLGQNNQKGVKNKCELNSEAVDNRSRSGANNLALLLDSDPLDDMSIMDIEEIKEEPLEVKVEEITEEEETHTSIISEPIEYDGFHIYPINKKVEVYNLSSIRDVKNGSNDRPSKQKCKVFLHQFKKVVKRTITTKRVIKSSTKSQTAPKRKYKKRQTDRWFISDAAKRRRRLERLQKKLKEKIDSIEKCARSISREVDEHVVEIKAEDISDIFLESTECLEKLDNLERETIKQADEVKKQCQNKDLDMSDPKDFTNKKPNEKKLTNYKNNRKNKKPLTEIEMFKSNTKKRQNTLNNTPVKDQRLPEDAIKNNTKTDIELTESKVEVLENHNTVNKHCADSFAKDMPVLVKQALPMIKEEYTERSENVEMPTLNKEVHQNVTVVSEPDINIITERMFVKSQKCNKIIVNSKQYLKKQRRLIKNGKKDTVQIQSKKLGRIRKPPGRFSKLNGSSKHKLTLSCDNVAGPKQVMAKELIIKLQNLKLPVVKPELDNSLTTQIPREINITTKEINKLKIKSEMIVPNIEEKSIVNNMTITQNPKCSRSRDIKVIDDKRTFSSRTKLLTCEKCKFECSNKYLFKNHFLWCDLGKSRSNKTSLDYYEGKRLMVYLPKIDITDFELPVFPDFKTTPFNNEVEKKVKSEYYEGKKLVVNLTRLNKGYRMFRCRFCKYMDFEKKAVKFHAENCSMNNGCGTKKKNNYFQVFQCLHCPYTRHNIDKIKNHLKLHSKKSLYRCPHCSYSVSSRTDFYKHRLSHENSDTILMYKCYFCNYRSRDKGVFDEHIKSCHSTKMLNCDSCPYYTHLSDNMILHQKCHLTNNDKAEDSDHYTPKQPTLKCSKCEYRTHKLYRLKRHKLTHTPVKFYKCQFCPFKRARKESVRRHEENHKEDRIGNKCPFCSYRGLLYKHLPLHEKHNDTEQCVQMNSINKCPHCPYKTLKTSAFEKHHRLTHQKQLRPHENIYNSEQCVRMTALKKCPHCSYKTWKTNTFERHRSTHMKLKDIKNMNMFSCKECPFKTKRKYLLEEHSAKHNATEGQKCPQCSYKSTNKSLTRHLRWHTVNE